MAVPGFALKFWMITSWTCRYFRCSSRMANSDSARSRSVSPIPTRIPLVNGIDRRPASSIVRQPLRRGLQHDPHRRADVLQAGHVLPRHHAGIEVRKQARLFYDLDGHRPKVVQRRVVSAFGQPRARGRVPLLRLVAEGEKGLLAPHPAPGTGDGHDLLGGEEGPVQLRGWLGERAVVAVVLAEHGERDEHFPRVRDGLAVSEIAKSGGDIAQLAQRLASRREQRLHLLEGERPSGAGPCQGTAQLVGEVDHARLECTAGLTLSANSGKIQR
jgi:hypothetical protein